MLKKENTANPRKNIRIKIYQNVDWTVNNLIIVKNQPKYSPRPEIL